VAKHAQEVEEVAAGDDVEVEGDKALDEAVDAIGEVAQLGSRGVFS
jgi:hypothetical protein